jgi:pSer/pThr/pTyr-binding forkhead associated (FHA) protein
MAVKLRVLAGPPGAEPAPPAERMVDVDEHLTEIRIGRRAGLEVELPFPSLAPIHARIVRRATGFTVEDLGDPGGTWLDGDALAPGGARALWPGAVIRVGGISVVFEGVGSQRPASEGTATLARRLVSDLFGARADGEAPRLIPTTGWPADVAPPAPLRLTVPDRRYLAGRGESCDLVLPTDDVSREHAVIVRSWAGVHIRDLGSKNGVRVAGRPIDGEHRLRDGDAVEIGSFALRVDDPEDRYLRALEAPDGGGAPGEPEVAAAPPARRGAFPAARVAVVLASAVLLAVIFVTLMLVLG